MLQFDVQNRIPTYAMYLNLKEIIRKLSLTYEIPLNMKNDFPLIQTDPRSDWFDNEMDIRRDIFNQIPKLGTNIKIQNLKK